MSCSLSLLFSIVVLSPPCVFVVCICFRCAWRMMMLCYSLCLLIPMSLSLTSLVFAQQIIRILMEINYSWLFLLSFTLCVVFLPFFLFLLVIASFPFYFRIVVSSLSLCVLCISISLVFSLSVLTTFIFRLIKTETGRAILRVISGPRAFRVVLLARLTPIPFGLQNTIFGVSFLSFLSYFEQHKPHRTFIIAENLGYEKFIN